MSTRAELFCGKLEPHDRHEFTVSGKDIGVCQGFDRAVFPKKPIKGGGPKVNTDSYPRSDYWKAIEMMGTRMSFSQQKYGDLEVNYPEPKSAMATAMQRIGMYHESGNTEHLLDAANMLIIEHLFPSHEDAHFEAEGSEKSPGLRGKEEEKSWIPPFLNDLNNGKNDD